MNDKQLIKDIKALTIDTARYRDQLSSINGRNVSMNEAVTENSNNVSVALRTYGLDPSAKNTKAVETAKAALSDSKKHLAMDSESSVLLSQDLKAVEADLKAKVNSLASLRLSSMRSGFINELDENFQELVPHLARMMALLKLTQGTPIAMIDLTKWLKSNMPSLLDDATSELNRINGELHSVNENPLSAVEDVA